jgi:hypothetical protein
MSIRFRGIFVLAGALTLGSVGTADARHVTRPRQADTGFKRFVKFPWQRGIHYGRGCTLTPSQATRVDQGHYFKEHARSRSLPRTVTRPPSANAGRKSVLPLNTQTYRGSDGRVHVASSPQPRAYGGNPANGSRTGNGYTVFRNSGGAGTAMDSRGNIRSGNFTFSPSTGRTIFVPSR